MPLQRSTDDFPALNEACGGDPICHICKKDIVNNTDSTETVCGHIFHRICITGHAKTHTTCPLCNIKIIKDASSQKSGSIMLTRAGAKAKTYDLNRPTGAYSENDNENPNTFSQSNTSNGNPSGEYIKRIVSSAIADQQSQMLFTLTQQMTKLIEQSISTGFSRLSQNNIPRINTSSPSANINPVMQTLPDVEQRTLEQLLGLPATQNSSANANRSHTNTSHAVSDLLSRPDKVSQIIYNWKLKFTGGSKSLPVENFIYRVEALTKQTLSGNFTILCMNASSLFDDKAADWFWRFHKTFPNFRWNDLCKALKEQYKDSRTDVDLRELIRDRKQKSGEAFDHFYESVVELVDRLAQPLPDRTLVEILRRNLLPEIQHEILNMSIDTIAELRDICRRREFFLQDMRRRHGVPSTKPVHFQKRLSEVECMDDPAVEIPQNEEILEINLKCWNCRKAGHRYQDCLEDRSVFCYGCGEPQTYKPNCKNCSGSKNFHATAPKGAQKFNNRQSPAIQELN